MNKELRKFLAIHLIKESHVIGNNLNSDKINKFELKRLYESNYKDYLDKVPGIISGKKKIINSRLSTKIIFEYFKNMYLYEFDKYNSLDKMLEEIVNQFPSVYDKDRILACILYELI